MFRRSLSTKLPNMQKALRCNANGRFLEDFPVPKPLKGEILVQNEVVASNPKDWKYPKLMKDYNYVEGSDCAGTVCAVGEGVDNFKIGQRVAGFSRMASLEDRNGSYAQYTIVPTNTVIGLPDKVSFEEGATLPLGILTSTLALFSPRLLNMASPLKEQGQPEPKTLLINGAATSVGVYASQLAKLAGHRVIGVAGKGANYATEYGTDIVVDYRSKNHDTLAKELQAHGPFSHVFDAVANYDSVAYLAKALQPHGGTITVVNPRLQEDKIKPLLLGNVNYTTVGVTSCHKKNADFAQKYTQFFTKLLEEGKLRGNRYRVMPNGLEGVSEGLDLLAHGKVSAEKLVYRIRETPSLA